MNKKSKQAYMVGVSEFVSDKRTKQAYMVEVSEFVSNKRTKTKCRKLNLRYLRTTKTKIARYLHEHCPTIFAILKELKVDVLLRYILGSVEK